MEQCLFRSYFVSFSSSYCNSFLSDIDDINIFISGGLYLSQRSFRCLFIVVVKSSGETSVWVAYCFNCKENISHFIKEGGRDSLGLGVGIAYPAAETIAKLLAKANAQASGVGHQLPSELKPAGLAVSSTAPVVADNSAANEEKKEEQAPADPGAGFGGFF